MKRALIILMVSGLWMAQNVIALPLNLLNDTLIYNSGIHSTPNWDNNGTWVNWNITQQGDDVWRYEYVWHTDGRDLSHIILEVTEGAVSQDFWNWNYRFSRLQSDPSIGWFSEDNGTSNPGMPGSVYGIKFDLSSDTPLFGFSFETWRPPVWGDFYAKGGQFGLQATYAYNLGFSDPDQNDGRHIAVPNGGDIIRVPDAGFTGGLLGIATLGIMLLRRRLMSRAN